MRIWLFGLNIRSRILMWKSSQILYTCNVGMFTVMYVDYSKQRRKGYFSFKYPILANLMSVQPWLWPGPCRSLTHCTGIHTHTRTRARAYTCTPGKPLTSQIMEGNVFHFGLFEKAGTIFPWHSLFGVGCMSHHTQFKTTAISPSGVEFTGCSGTVSGSG